MILYCALLALIPTLIALGFYLYHQNIEFAVTAGITFVACIAIAAGIFYGIRSSKVSDTELLNGVVTSRYSHHVSCSHSYECNCRMEGSGKDEHEVCDTCYEHSYDVNWTVASTVGDIDIQREDRQGLVEPKRWDQAYVGQPFTAEHSYDNYMLMDLNSVLFGQKGDVKKFQNLLPEYPQVYDYYHSQHFINEGVPLSAADVVNWQNMVTQINTDLGSKKQVDLIVVLANTDDPNYVYALKSWWKNGKKNDAIVVLGSTDGHKMAFADVVTWETNADFRVAIQNDLENIGSIDQRGQINNVLVNDITNGFTRLHMKNYKYMLNDFSPSTNCLALIELLFIILAGVANYSVLVNLPDENGNGRNYRRSSYDY